MTEMPIRCGCGTLRGTAQLSPENGIHVVCFCNDCQAFIRFLGRNELLDEWGGTHIFQTAPSGVRITEGADALCCMRLSRKGMHRWYCGKCKTPIGNTLGPRVPFVGLIDSIIDFGSVGRQVDDVLGKPLVYGFTEAAIGGPPPHAEHNRKFLFLAKVVTSLGKWWITGKGQPSPFFDEQRAPRAEVQILSPEERRSL